MPLVDQQLCSIEHHNSKHQIGKETMQKLQTLEVAVLLTLLLLSQTQATEYKRDQLPAAPTRGNSFFDWLVSIFLPSSPPVTMKPTKKPENCAACTCGTPNTVKRIVGGYEAKENQYPWMAMLLLRNRFYCGGSLVSDLYVVSAAHCIKGFPQNLISVKLMGHKRTGSKGQEISRKVDKVMVHQDYTSRTFDSDISLIKLDQRVEMSQLLRPVCMPMSGNSYEGTEAIITGWGATSEGGSLASTLQEVRVPILSQEECRSSMYDSERITDNMLCAGQSEGGKDACQGDSGGPLHINMAELNTFHLAGVVSWGEGCARPDYPGIYTRVTQFLTWIEENTGDACKCGMPTKKLLPIEIDIEN